MFSREKKKGQVIIMLNPGTNPNMKILLEKIQEFNESQILTMIFLAELVRSNEVIFKHDNMMAGKTQMKKKKVDAFEFIGKYANPNHSLDDFLKEKHEEIEEEERRFQERWDIK